MLHSSSVSREGTTVSQSGSIHNGGSFCLLVCSVVAMHVDAHLLVFDFVHRIGLKDLHRKGTSESKENEGKSEFNIKSAEHQANASSVLLSERLMQGCPTSVADTIKVQKHFFSILI